MRLTPHEAECVQSTELCPGHDTQGGWRNGGRERKERWKDQRTERRKGRMEAMKERMMKGRNEGQKN